MMKRLVCLCLAFLSACGPLSVEQAERQCFERARLAQQPRGEVALGVGTGGRSTGSVEVTISSDFLLGRDPAAIYETCVMAKSGAPPSRPLHARPDWKG